MRTFDNIPALLQHAETQAHWEDRRQALIDTVARIEYGRRPELPYQVSWELLSRTWVMEDTAEQLITHITITTKLGSHTFPLYTYLPKRAERVPATVLICSKAKVLKPMTLPAGFNPEDFLKLFEKMGIIMDAPLDLNEPRSALDLEKDLDDSHWPVRAMMARGHAVSGFYAVDAQPDNGDFAEGLAKVFGTTKDRQPEEWGVIAMWSFAAQCVADYLQTLPELDSTKLGITGHSRCGKAALWAGVNDTRFAWVMPNNSGCCGAALLRGKHGENLTSITAMMGYWFAPAFRQYAGREKDLPFDQHTVLALVAPRLLHVASGSTDFWADPMGEHQSTVLASQVYHLYGNPLLDPAFPEVNSPIHAGAIGYHLRQGPHLLTEYDWHCLIDHAEEFLKI